MKKESHFRLIYVLAFFLLSGFLSTGIAQESPLGHDTISLGNDTDDDGYDEEVYVEELPESIKASVDEAYHGFEISRAYKSNEGNYRIELENGSDKSVVYYDMNGKFIKAEDNNDASSMQDM